MPSFSEALNVKSPKWTKNKLIDELGKKVYEIKVLNMLFATCII